MDDRITRVEGKQNETLRAQDAPPFVKGWHKLVRGQMHDGVERNDPMERTIPSRKRSQITLGEQHTEIALLCLRDHASRQIDAVHVEPGVGQVATAFVMPRAAA